MIDKFYSTSVFVTDQQRALDFYTNKLGFTVFTHRKGEGVNADWIEVGPVGTTSRIVLEAVAEPRPNFSIIFTCADATATCAELRERGVEISKDVSVEDWGTDFHFKDPDGNEFLVNQVSEQWATQQ